MHLSAFTEQDKGFVGLDLHVFLAVFLVSTDRLNEACPGG